MKTIHITKILLLLVAVAVSQNIFAQKKTEKDEFRINLTRNIDGKKEKIDRSFATKEEMMAYMIDNKLDMPAMTGEPREGKASVKVCEKKVIKSGDKVCTDKKISITEKEEGSIAGKINLEIATSDLNAGERATIIQSLMNIKGSKVEMKQEVSNATATNEKPVTGKKITITEKNTGADGKTDLEIATNDLNAEERASIIQTLMNIKGSKVEMKQEQANMAKLNKENSSRGSALPDPLQVNNTGNEAISGLQLFPNPNNGQFHLAFNTGKQADVTLRMMDINGKLVYSDVVKDATGKQDKDIYIRPALSNGTYVLEAEANGQKITTQVVVQ